MSGIKLLLILVIAVLIVVLFKYVQIKRQIRNLSKQMTDLTTGKSEKMLDISLVDKDIEQLAAVLNQYNEKQRQSIASTLRHEMYLKESIANISHDLRTPLTVLKGYNEMLQASDNSQTRETAATMGKHISRMENYVSSMSNIRRMEDTQPEYKLIDLQPLVSSLYDSAKIVCTKNGKELILQNDIPILQLSLDSAFISQVCTNLISNAVRYARTLVTISFTLHDNGLLLSVSDDGNGFDKDSLQKAANPYFTGESNHSEHFGLGLYICKLLCEHHNGYLQIRNTVNGANVSAYFKSPTL